MFAKKTNKSRPNPLLDDQADKKRREYNECVSQIKQEMGQIGHLALRQEAVRRMTEKKLAEERATALKESKLRKKKKSFSSVTRLFRKDSGVSHEDDVEDDCSDDGSVGSKSILSSGMGSLSSMFFSTDDDLSHGTSHSLMTAHSFVTAPADFSSHRRGLSGIFPVGNPPVQRRGSVFFRDAGNGPSQVRASLFRDSASITTQRRGSLFRDGSAMSSRSSVSSIVSGDQFIRRRSSVVGENPFSSNDSLMSSVRQELELSDSDDNSVISVSSEDDEDDIRRFRRAYSMRRSTGSATAEEFIHEMGLLRHSTSKRRSSVSAANEVDSAADEAASYLDDREKSSADRRRSSRSIADDSSLMYNEKRLTKRSSLSRRSFISDADEAELDEEKDHIRRNDDRRRSLVGTADEGLSTVDDEDHFQNVLLAQRAVLEKRYSSGRSHERCEKNFKGIKTNPRLLLGMRAGEKSEDDASNDKKCIVNNMFLPKATRKDRVSNFGDVPDDYERNEAVDMIGSIPFSDDEEKDSDVGVDHNDSYRDGSLICGWRRNSSISCTTSDDEESEDEELICSWRRST
ncbi:hypothetical protein ACHAXS_004086 [Conticribra weissflogii]